MNHRLNIGKAILADLDDLARLRAESIRAATRGGYTDAQREQWASVNPRRRQRDRILDGCLLVGRSRGRLVATSGLDLGNGEMVGLFVHPDTQGMGLGRRLTEAVERLAIRFGMQRLKVEAAAPAVAFYTACGYQAEPGEQFSRDPRTGLQALTMWREFPRRQTHYGARIRDILEHLGLPLDYGQRHRMQLQEESSELATIGYDVFDREQMLHPEAALAWQAMRAAAMEDDVQLQVASAYRSVDYQADIVARKKERGQNVEQILAVTAAPGFSEHHTGRALDLTTPGADPLENEFENTAAFEWLMTSAGQFGFRLSYPRDNRHNILYEPWHWFYAG